MVAAHTALGSSDWQLRLAVVPMDVSFSLGNRFPIVWGVQVRVGSAGTLYCLKAKQTFADDGAFGIFNVTWVQMAKGNEVSTISI